MFRQTAMLERLTVRQNTDSGFGLTIGRVGDFCAEYLVYGVLIPLLEWQRVTAGIPPFGGVLEFRQAP
jgi:hypothetical protein